MGGLNIVGKLAKGAKKQAPFFSKADVVLDELPRNKGLGNEFLAELVKKGAKPTELKERGIDKALKDAPKMTKAEVQKLFEEKAPPKVQEKVLTSEVTDYDEWLEAKAQEIYGVDWFDLRKDEQKALDKMYGELPLTQHDKYKTPGGENYREILLKLPVKDSNDLWREQVKQKHQVGIELAFAERKKAQEVFGFLSKEADEAQKKELALRNAYNADLSATAKKQYVPSIYLSSHYKTEPNILAHIRVQDFKTPDGKKVLLVDEIQSDWHQAGRNLRNKEIKRIMNETGVDKKTASAQVPDDYGYKTKEQTREAKTVIDKDGYWEVRDQNNEFVTNIMGYQYPDADQAKILEVANARIRDDVPTQIKQSEQVPDAPFKKNWHELAMKRVLDYAAENGYDTVAITPGAEQANRYDLSKQLSRVAYREGRIQGYDPDGALVISKSVEPKDLPDFVGKELGAKMAENAQRDAEVRLAVRQAIKDDLPEDQIYALREQLNAIPDEYSGLDLQVGGEGMKGFYDKILPDYLNNYGKKYGAQMGQMRLPVAPADSTAVQGYSLGDEYMQGRATWSEFLQANPRAAEEFSPAFHSFNITPQMREEIQTKGQPMYGKVAMPVLEGLAVGSGAATIAPEVFDTNNEQSVQNPVHFTENPDAMLLELMQRN